MGLEKIGNLLRSPTSARATTTFAPRPSISPIALCRVEIGSAATNENDVARAFLRHPACDRQAQSSQASGDEIRARGFKPLCAGGRRLSDQYFSNMPRRRHVTKRLRGIVQTK